jgi:hypothetical protein
MMSVRRVWIYCAALVTVVVLTAAGVALTGLLPARGRPGSRPDQIVTDDIERYLVTFAAQLDAGQPYRDPTPDERQVAVEGLRSLLSGVDTAPEAVTAPFTHLGFSHRVDVDDATGRRYLMLSTSPGDQRPWGVVLVDLSAPIRLVVEVPHPKFDQHTEVFGARLFRAVPGSILLMAGAHRRAGDGAGDVAHNDRSLFTALTDELAATGRPQLQLHGFADASLAGRDAVVSTGIAPPSASAARVADRLADIDLRVCRPWQETCGDLEGTLNVQARQAARLGTVFVHLEMNNRVRTDDALRTAVVGALTAARIDNA